ncbi:putative restriction endonuclease [Bernardetia litoralis DSM 6794]|uniref:Putative restriction endonuclease n=1 Tax=Bernardetia litoralis (strain ATCC 23117 / DSM 6794 / NBRC 15988 / NCIMB 1366 / Fx l1 / Sio-4) TaxID=880071 RepID=I4AJQ4_BERLS|nr:HNH endonuclease [Bernardetia litoralis]AFM04189.1 putative restriction endonuclease [Bernardetia litoralis DSM 6794]
MMQYIKKYISKIRKIKRGVTKYGKAPHKPVLLLSIIDKIESSNITENKIFITPDLIATFKDNFSFLVDTPHNSDFILPFYHLQGDNFWHLKSKSNYKIDSFIRSFELFNEKLDYGFFDSELFELLNDDNSRNILKTTLLDYHFSNKKQNYLQNKGNEGYIKNLEKVILNEEEYVISVEEETQFVRGSLFKKLIPRVYNFTCAISEMKIISSHGFSFIDACHIVPFSISQNDTVSNGIALCPNLHRAFDRGLITINEKYKVLVSPHFAEDENNNYSLKKIEGKSISLPFGNVHYPKVEYLKWHLDNVFKV